LNRPEDRSRLSNYLEDQSVNKSTILNVLKEQYQISSQQLKNTAIDFSVNDVDLLEARSKLKELYEEILLHEKKKAKGILGFLGL